MFMSHNVTPASVWARDHLDQCISAATELMDGFMLSRDSRDPSKDQLISTSFHVNQGTH